MMTNVNLVCPLDFVQHHAFQNENQNLNGP